MARARSAADSVGGSGHQVGRLQQVVEPFQQRAIEALVGRALHGLLLGDPADDEIDQPLALLRVQGGRASRSAMGPPSNSLAPKSFQLRTSSSANVESPKVR